MGDRQFGIHKKERPNPIIDDAERRLVESGVLLGQSPLDMVDSLLDRYSLLSHLKPAVAVLRGAAHMIQFLTLSSRCAETIVLVISALATVGFFVGVVVLWPSIAKGIEDIAKALGDMFSGKPLVPG